MAFRLSLAAASLAALCTAQLTPTRLRVEYLTSPICIDESIPRFSFAVTAAAGTRGAAMSAYQIIVTPTSIGPVSPVWNSGQVASNSSLNIPYAGQDLNPDYDYTWFVQVWDGSGSAGPIATSTFSTALFSEGDWMGASWVAPPSDSNLLRANLNIASGVTITRARLYIAGLGYYKSTLNGRATDTHALGGFTTFESRVTYNVVDVTSLLYPGCNTLGVALGRGWYVLLGVGPLQLRAMLSIKTSDGMTTYLYSSSGSTAATTSTVGATTSIPLNFTGAAGPVTSDDIYAGEAYDARLVQVGWDTCSFSNASAWQPATNASSSPASYNAIMSSSCVPIEVEEDFNPVALDQPSPGTYVIDFGQNMAGYTTLKVMCDAGTTILLQYGEILYPNGSVHNHYAPGAKMQGRYTCAGTGDFETYTTLFSYYGFRYVQLYGFPGTPDEDTLTAHFVHSTNARIGDFSSSSPLLNAVQHATVYAALSNQMDVPTDCPQRERRGWLGDAQLSCETNIHNLDMAAFYTKWLRDLADTQIYDNATLNAKGALPDCVPFYGHGHTDSDPGWGIAVWNVLAWTSSYYADIRLLERYYPMARTYLESWITNHVVNNTMNFCLWGDWCPASPASPGGGCHFCTPDYGSFFYVTALTHTVAFAQTLNISADITRYTQLLTAARSAYQVAFYNASTGAYGDGAVVSQLFALTLEMPTPAQLPGVLSFLTAALNDSFNPWHNTGGIIETKLLYPILTKYNLTAAGVAMNLFTDFPSYGYWIDQGATTLWEGWGMTATGAQASYNHIMFGGQGVWYFTALAGINRDASAPSWSSLTLSPPTPATLGNSLSYASASMDTALGLISSAWSAPAGPYAGATCGFVGENSVLTLSCLNATGGVGPGVFTGVTFASYGTPLGSCMSGLTANSSCNSTSSVSVVAAACLGRSACSITANNTVFGGDPCFDVVKSLGVVLTGTCTFVAYAYDITVPIGAATMMILPTGGPAATATVSELGAGVTVWSGGAFTPSPGITSATVAPSGDALMVTVGSGTYSFRSTVT